MTQSPMVSVIVPCFNYGHYLGEALESVQRQSLTAWECIVIDDGSTDRTGEVAGSFASKDPRFSCVRQMNRGPSAARNAGLAKAAAPYVQLLDADDLLEPRKLEAHVGFLAEHADYDMVYSPMRFFTDTGSRRTFSRARNRSQRDWMILWPDTTDKFLLALVEGNTFPISAPVFRRLTLDEVGHFDESLLSHEDWEFWLRWAFAGKRFVGLDAPATRTLIREHGQSLTRRTVTMAETRLAVRDRIERLAPAQALRLKNRECTGYDECDLGAAYMAAGHWRNGMRWYRSGFAKANRKVKAVRLLLTHFIPEWILGLYRKVRWGYLARGTA